MKRFIIGILIGILIGFVITIKSQYPVGSNEIVVFGQVFTYEGE